MHFRQRNSHCKDLKARICLVYSKNSGRREGQRRNEKSDCLGSCQALAFILCEMGSYWRVLSRGMNDVFYKLMGYSGYCAENKV